MSDQRTNGSNGTVDVKKNTALMCNREEPLNSRISAVRSILSANAGQILQALPKHISQERMIRLFLSEIRKTPKLLDCTPESLFAAMAQAGSLGLETDGVLGHAYLVPFKGEAVLIPGYKGLLDLARRQSKILIKTRCVYVGDKFAYEEGDNDYIRHIPNQDPNATFSEDEITHVYLVAKDAEGVVICRNVWTRAQVDAHARKYSKSYHKSDSPWQTNWPTMARKTLIRDAINRGEIPVSVELKRLAAQDEIFEAEFARKTEVSTDLMRLDHDPNKAANQLAELIPDDDDGPESLEPEPEPETVVPGATVEEDPTDEYEAFKQEIANTPVDQLEEVGLAIAEAYDNRGVLTDEQFRTLKGLITRKVNATDPGESPPPFS